MEQLLVVVLLLFLGGGGLLCCVFPDTWAFLWLWKAEPPLQLQRMGPSLPWPLLLQSTGSRAHGLQ